MNALCVEHALPNNVQGSVPATIDFASQVYCFLAKDPSLHYGGVACLVQFSKKISASKLLPPKVFELSVAESADDLYPLAVSKKVVIEHCEGTGYDRYCLGLSLHNPSKQRLKICIRKGTIFEQHEGRLCEYGHQVQSLAARDDTVVHLRPGERKKYSLFAYCCDATLPPPQKDSMSVTPFIFTNKQVIEQGGFKFRSYLDTRRA